jgi:hypothetical protein
MRKKPDKLADTKHLPIYAARQPASYHNLAVTPNKNLSAGFQECRSSDWFSLERLFLSPKTLLCSQNLQRNYRKRLNQSNITLLIT